MKTGLVVIYYLTSNLVKYKSHIYTILYSTGTKHKNHIDLYKLFVGVLLGSAYTHKKLIISLI